MRLDELCSPDSEAGIIATLIHKPDFYFHSEHLLPGHFTDKSNACVYTAIKGLVEKGITIIDSYNIIEYLNSSDATRKYAEEITIDRLNEFMDMSYILARQTPEEYKMLVDNVLDLAFRRDAIKRLKACEDICYKGDRETVQQQIYGAIDDVMTEYSTANDIPPYREVIEQISPKKKLPATIACGKFKPPKQEKKAIEPKAFPENCMEKYEKRADKLAVWEKEGISRASLDKFQVYYDSISNRLVYPIRNMNGQIVNIGGRTLDPRWKEKKMRKYTYFSGWNDGVRLVYGLFENMDAILEKKEVIIFEGCKSVLMADTWGIHNTGALLTSHLSNHQFKILAKLGARVVFALDKDVRIRDDHNISRLKRYVAVEYFWDKDNLLDEKDAPVDKGIEVFQKLYEQRIRYK